MGNLKNTVLILLVFISLAGAQTLFNKYFIDKTMRVDYFHTGTAVTEYFSLERVYQEGNWPGSKLNLIDTLNNGAYLLKVFDLNTNQLLYSRGFCTVFSEWQTTEDAQNSIMQTMHETVRFPFPKRPVQVVIAVRDRNNVFMDKFSTTVEPYSRFVNFEQKTFPYPEKDYLINGTAENKVDIVIMGDGYAAHEMNKFYKDVDRYTKTFFSTEPFKSRKQDFNIRVIAVESQDSGIDEPRKDKWRQTQLGTSYNSLDSPRYILTLENKMLRDIASTVPYDQIYILVNSPRYGGGGIYNWYSTCFTGSKNNEPEWWSDYVFVHEFGHAFAGLADEYYTSNVSYEEFYTKGVEPWEPNITQLLDPNNPKWSAFMDKGTPIPTPWEKSSYDTLGSRLQKYERDTPEYIKTEEKMRQVLTQSPKKLVGCYEGAGYSATGLYRPYIDCRMFSKSLVDFCPVCTDAINKMIDFYIQ